MSFFKKLTSEIKDLISDKDEKSKDGKDKHDGTHAHTGMNQYGAPAPPPDQWQLPPGWRSQWDQNSQRWYFIEQSTGRSQWEPPQPGYGSVPYPQHPPDGASYQHYPSNGAPYQQHPPAGGPYPYYNQSATHNPSGGVPMYGGDAKKEQKDRSGKGGMIAAGAGGLAVGALAGAALAGDSSDDEHGHAYQAGPGPAGYYGAPTPATAPVPLEQNPELSSSQRSSLQEAREDYEQAQREVAADSDPDSSDIEELQEAREEYHSEVESAHEELED